MISLAALSILQSPGSFTFQLQPPGSQRATILTATQTLAPDADQSFQRQFDDAVRLLNRLILHRQASAQQPDATESDPLLRLGRLLHNQLLPPVIQQALRALPAGSPLILVANNPEIPWELLHDGHEYLAVKHQVARQMTVNVPPHVNPVINTSRPWSCLLIGNPTGDLPHADVEIEQLFSLIEAMPDAAVPRILMRSRATRDAVLQNLASGDYDLSHYSGHALFDVEDPQSSGLVLADEEILTATEIQRNVSGRPFVFLNGCESARSQIQAEAAAGLTYLGLGTQGVAAAFVQGGAQGFIGTFWPIYDTASQAFALTFYRSALHGDRIGSALHCARTTLAQPHDPLWAAYVHYGPPDTVLHQSHKIRRQPASLLALRLLGVDELFASHDAETAAQELKLYLAHITRQIARYGGTVQSIGYDTVLALFGVPLAQENDALRAVSAALELTASQETREEGVPHPPALGLALGLNSGQLVIGNLDTTAQPTDFVTGPVAAEALALARQAGHNELLISEATRRLVGHRFHLQVQRDHHNTTALTAYQVRATASTTGAEWPPSAHTLPMVSRQEELALLQQAWQACQQGQGQVIDIIGGAGIGKSRLLHAFYQTIGLQATWLVATSPSAYEAGPYWLIGQLLRTALDISLADGEAEMRTKVCQTLHDLLGADVPKEEQLEAQVILMEVLTLPTATASQPESDPQVQQRQLARLLGRLLAASAVPKPLIIALEDVHRGDEASLKVLNLVLGRIAQLPVLVITLFRPEAEWQPPWHQFSTQVRLTELSEDEARILLATLLGVEDVTQEIAHLVLSAAQGNPFFLRELVTSLEEADLLHFDQGQWCLARPLQTLDIPDSIDRLIRTRVETLPSAALTILPLLAVIGDRCASPLLQEVAANSSEAALLDEGLLQLEERKFIGQHWRADVYYFDHALIQSVVYAGLPAVQRQRYHRRVGRTLERTGTADRSDLPELLAHHYYHSDDWVNAVLYGQRVAQQAAHAWANESALTWCERALEKVQDGERALLADLSPTLDVDQAQLTQWHVEILEIKADVLTAIGQSDDAITTYQDALQLCRNSSAFSLPHQANLQCKVAVAYHNKGDLDAAQAAVGRGLQLLNGQSCLEAGQLHLYSSILHYRWGNLTEALMACERGSTIIEQSESTRDLAQAYNLQGLIQSSLGESQQALHAHQRSVELYQTTNDLIGLEKAYSNLGCVYQDLSRWDEALHYFQASATLSEKTGEERRRAAAAMNLGEIYRRQGQVAPAIAANQQAHAIGTACDFAEVVGLACMNLGVCYLKQSDFSTAQKMLQQSQDTFAAINVTIYSAELCYYRAELHLQMDRPQAGLQLAQQALDWTITLGRRLEAGQAHRVLGQAFHRLGQFAEADIHLRESLTILQAQTSPYEVGLTLVALAQLRATQAQNGQDGAQLSQQALAYCDEVVAIFEELGAALDLKKAQTLCLSLCK
ncbi:CHAT domain-containing protein [Chloroflexi bacterium TSY]|nr:CHAT domain-containing protein [Chloroflexi bacterium TSY]